MEMFKKMVDECAKKESASSSDIEEILAKKLPSTQIGKCVHACLGKHEARHEVKCLQTQLFISKIHFYHFFFQIGETTGFVSKLSSEVFNI